MRRSSKIQPFEDPPTRSGRFHRGIGLFPLYVHLLLAKLKPSFLVEINLSVGERLVLSLIGVVPLFPPQVQSGVREYFDKPKRKEGDRNRLSITTAVIEGDPVVGDRWIEHHDGKFQRPPSQ